jgi:hypothetical protein
MIPERKSHRFLLIACIQMALLALVFVHASHRRKEDEPLLTLKARVAERLELTDLCIFTDARYTRHPNMADLNTPFQDAPLSLEHFPSGSIVSPPPHLRNGAARYAAGENSASGDGR